MSGSAGGSFGCPQRLLGSGSETARIGMFGQSTTCMPWPVSGDPEAWSAPGAADRQRLGEHRSCSGRSRPGDSRPDSPASPPRPPGGWSPPAVPSRGKSWRCPSALAWRSRGYRAACDSDISAGPPATARQAAGEAAGRAPRGQAHLTHPGLLRTVSTPSALARGCDCPPPRPQRAFSAFSATEEPFFQFFISLQKDGSWWACVY